MTTHIRQSPPRGRPTRRRRRTRSAEKRQSIPMTKTPMKKPKESPPKEPNSKKMARATNSNLKVTVTVSRPRMILTKKSTWQCSIQHKSSSTTENQYPLQKACLGRIPYSTLIGTLIKRINPFFASDNGAQVASARIASSYLATSAQVASY